MSYYSHASMIRFCFLIVLFCLSNKISNAHSNTTTDEKLQPKDVWESTHGKIIFSAVVFRHGDRYPFGDPLPNSDLKGEWMPSEKEQLTKKGRNRAYQLGRWLRTRYSPLIKDEPYNHLVLNMLSSHTDRTIMTGQLLLAGLYPPVHENELWNKDLPWQPIPVYSLPEKDRIIGNREPCPRFDFEMKHLKNYSEVLKFYELHKETLDYIKENSKRSPPSAGNASNIEDILMAGGVYDTLEISKELGWKLPSWADKIHTPSLRNKIGAMSFKLRLYNHEMKRLRGGPLLSHIIEELKKKRDNAQSKKLFQFYSGHDLNIFTLLDMLGVRKEDDVPGFCSTILFELRKLEKDYIVTVAHKNNQHADLELMKIPKVPEICTLDEFINVTKDLIPENWDAECQSTGS